MKNSKGRILSPVKKGDGHLYVTLRKDGVQKEVSIAALVMGTFVGPMPDGQEIVHIDGDLTNNNLENLRYETRTGI